MTHEIELIQSRYHPDEALEVLCNLIQQKIAYHTQKTLRHQEMFGSPDLHAEQRCAELQKTKKMLIQELKLLDPNTLLQINGSISISVIAQQQAS
ncbi:MAG: hypothetical protein RLZZ211_284 [Bacteroidota bacterium]|jgi:hypothetical protein